MCLGAAREPMLYPDRGRGQNVDRGARCERCRRRCRARPRPHLAVGGPVSLKMAKLGQQRWAPEALGRYPSGGQGLPGKAAEELKDGFLACRRDIGVFSVGKEPDQPRQVNQGSCGQGASGIRKAKPKTISPNRWAQAERFEDGRRGNRSRRRQRKARSIPPGRSE